MNSSFPFPYHLFRIAANVFLGDSSKFEKGSTSSSQCCLLHLLFLASLCHNWNPEL